MGGRRSFAMGEAHSLALNGHNAHGVDGGEGLWDYGEEVPEEEEEDEEDEGDDIDDADYEPQLHEGGMFDDEEEGGGWDGGGREQEQQQQQQHGFGATPQQQQPKSPLERLGVGQAPVMEHPQAWWTLLDDFVPTEAFRNNRDPSPDQTICESITRERCRSWASTCADQGNPGHCGCGCVALPSCFLLLS
ncbi:hypothetical protein DUNSADRAFT_6016 [Dunaliella salina]|uniref:Encoded protein n=1 Tax=Dunaliella salina TaxID=3046 RepID=A0ABQ7GP54_DUNSA|nr:hypothetical protein DUNSADRAFT_6016 [Dunaliella salina]|eukprot:KAF5836380.1 hypothetical protein DUNSADRAFT_6016 [Dunaliella salina]